jgi:hypothetical protein
MWMRADEDIAVKRRRRHEPVWYIAWGIFIASVLLAIFVHRGLLGIAGFVGAAVVARYMFFTNRQWITSD